MPIPTDTFWNIKRLNIVFAASAVLLALVTVGSILQDFDKGWREPQRSGRVWDAALVDEKLQRDLTKEKQEQIDALQKTVNEKQQKVDSNDQVKKINATIKQLDSDISKMEFAYNTLKANVGVMESRLQDAISSGDKEAIKSWKEQVEKPRRDLNTDGEALYHKKQQLKEQKEQLAQITADVDADKKQLTKLQADALALQKKRESLQPTNIFAKLSAQVRAAPLMQFINPAEKIQQQVLPDILTEMPPLRVTTIDRCTTCHVNIANKDYSQDKVIGYLEEQLATARDAKLAETWSGTSSDALATRNAPGPVAMPEFWHGWASKLAPQLLQTGALKSRIGTLAKTVGPGKQTTVKVDGKSLESFNYSPDPTKKEDAASLALTQDLRDEIVGGLLRAWIAYAPAANSPAVKIDLPHVSVEIAANVDEKIAKPTHNSAMKYAEDVRTALNANVPPEQMSLLRERYRRGMIDEVNIARKKQGYAALDPNPVLLAHSRLDLYVDVDSKHSFEQIGCTSCHDGSGQETDFVVAAHTPRPIWVDDVSGAPVLANQINLKEAAPLLPKHHGEDLSSMLDAVYPEEQIVPETADHLHGIGHHATTQASTQPAHHEENIELPEHPPVDGPPVPYVDPATGKNHRAISQMKYWVRKYEPSAPRSFALVYHEWDWPMRPPQTIQSNCVRCHTDVYDIKETAPLVYEGRQLFTNLGCVDCHQMDSIAPTEKRLVGTDLRHITSKLSPAFINTWVWSPKAFRPSTKMPHFFMLENNSSDEEIRRTRQEARAITEYLVQTATPLPVMQDSDNPLRDPEKKDRFVNGTLPPVPAELKGSAEGGKVLFNNIGCLGCHSNLGDTTGEKRGSNDVTVGEKWIVQDLVKGGELAKKLEAETGKAPDAKALQTKALELFDGMSYNARQLYAHEHLSPDYSGVQQKYPDGTAKPTFMHHGPELSGIGTKLLADRKPEEARAWLFDWVRHPRHYSEYTVMPRLRLTDQQAIDLVEYLLSQKRPDDWKAEVTPIDQAKQIELTSLFLRSRFSNETATKKANEDAELIKLATDALTTPAVDAKQAEAQAKNLDNDHRRMVFLGKKLISNYGCMQCHAINGLETASSPCANLSDWGQKQVSKLDFGYLEHEKLEHLPSTSKVPMVNGLSVESAHLAHGELKHASQPVEVAWPHVEHSRISWLTQKLKNTRVWDRGKNLLEPGANNPDDPLGKPYDKLKMPTFYLKDSEVNALVNFVISNRERLIAPSLVNKTVTPEAKNIARGRQLVTKYNCVACHQIDQNALAPLQPPPVHQWYKSDQIMDIAPPSLRGEGNKVQHAWLFNFFKNVEPLRPLIQPKGNIRMPSFPATDEEWTAIIAFFNASSNRESRDLAKRLDLVHKYQTEAKKAVALKNPSTQPAPPAVASSATDQPGDDWYLQPSLAPAASYLREWALAKKQITEVDVDPLKPKELPKAFKTIAFKASFTAGLYDSPFPFVESPRPTISEERFKLGETFFHELQCLSCHAIGDEAAKGVVKDPKGPNLTLTHARLQRRWSRHWVQEPPVIQVGTKMPQFFSGLKVFKLDGLPWAVAQDLPPERIAGTNKKYGDTADAQNDLLLDFLYAAGNRNYTTVQPTPAPVTTAPAPKPATVPAPATKPVETKPAVAAPPAPVAGQSLTGKVVIEGKAPAMGVIKMDPACDAKHVNPVEQEMVVVSAKNELKNVVISIDVPGAPATPVPQQPAVLDQNGCMYEPHVLAMRLGQQWVMKNSDDFLHNVHSLADKNPGFNMGQPVKGQAVAPEQPKVAEYIHVKCDVHPWMSAYVAVFDHPFFAVSDENGDFKIDNLPPGEYTAQVWHEQLGTQEVAVKIEAGKKAELKITFKP